MLPLAPALIYALGFSFRKRSMVKQFLGTANICFISRPTQAPNGATVLVWASGPFGVGKCTHANTSDLYSRFKRLYVEDGFLRSVGLGADLVRPLSWVIDSRGIYYDASGPNDLENILQMNFFDERTLQRAAALREQLVATGLTKYNVGSKLWSRPTQADGLQVVLVPGQVETDAAIRLGTSGIATNLALLKAARHAHPDAWLVYKPHPDVVAGLRNSGVQEDLATQCCDEVITDVTMGALLESVNVVHVLTSLAGFEALLRGKQVICHGMPFYAGWGLTQDILPIPRRTRKLDINQLVAGVLLAYPTYVSGVTGEIWEAEQALAELLSWRSSAPDDLPLWRKILRPLLKHR